MKGAWALVTPALIPALQYIECCPDLNHSDFVHACDDDYAAEIIMGFCCMHLAFSTM